MKTKETKRPEMVCLAEAKEKRPDKVIKALEDFIIRVSSDKGKATETEIAVLPQVAKIWLEIKETNFLFMQDVTIIT